MPTIGYIQVNAYESYARLPLKDVSIAITATDGTAIALRLTNPSGQITPVEIPVPPLQDSQAPDPPELPYATVNLYAHLQGYELVGVENIQIFADVSTVQDLMLVPLPELPERWDLAQLYDTPPQNL